jgi:hypothetical protein
MYPKNMHTGKSKTKLAAAMGNSGTVSPVLKFIIALESRIRIKENGRIKLKTMRHNENKVTFWVILLENILNAKLPIATEISQLAKIKPIESSFP